MLPPGHIAGGFLAAEALIKIAKPNLPLAQLHQLLYWGMFFGFAPDLDMFWEFLQEKAFIIKDLKNHNHRKLLSHAPLLWLIAGLLIYFFATNEYIKCVGLLVWLGSWSHFILDSIEYGIMWLWPFSKKIYAFKDPELVLPNTETGFFKYWWTSVKLYTKFISFYLEIVVLISVLFFTNH